MSEEADEALIEQVFAEGFESGYDEGHRAGWYAALSFFEAGPPYRRRYEYPRGTEEPPALPRKTG